MSFWYGRFGFLAAIVVEQPAVVMQHLRDPPCHLPEQLSHLLVAWRLEFHEPRPLVYSSTAGHKHAIGHQHVEVQAQLKRRVEPLHERDRAVRTRSRDAGPLSTDFPSLKT
jgi:hypothetical protein